MNSKYYYFASSLPLLEFSSKPPFSYQKFLEDCERLLPDKDYKLVAAAKITSDTKLTYKNKTFDTWAGFQQRCCSEIARFRCQQSGKNPEGFVLGEGVWHDPFIAKHIKEASQKQDPLSCEKYLDVIKWKKLDELKSGHYFDIDFLIIYGLKLQILERYEEIGSSKGKEVFERFKNFEESEEVLEKAL